MTTYTGSIVGTNRLGKVGELSVVTGVVSLSAVTLATTDTLSFPILTQNGVTVPVEVVDFMIFSSTTTPASLIAKAGNSDNDAGFMAATGFTETGQMVRKGNGALIGTRIKNSTVTVTPTVSASASYTGDYIVKLLVIPTND